MYAWKLPNPAERSANILLGISMPGFYRKRWTADTMNSINRVALRGLMRDRGFFGERWLRFADLDAPIRRIVFTTFAVFVGVALAIGTSKYIGGPVLPTFALFHFPRNIFLGGVVMASVAIAMLLAGAAHLRTRWRYPMIAIIMLAIAGTRFAVPGVLPDRVYYTLIWLPLPFLLLIVALTWAAPRYRITVVLLASLAIIIFFALSIIAATFAFGTGNSSSTAYAVTVFTLIMLAAGVAVTPAVMMVGFDAAELSTEGATKSLRFLARFRFGATLMRVVLPIVGLLLMYKIIIDLKHFWPTNRWFILTLAVLIVTAFLVFLVLMRRRAAFNSATHFNLNYLPVLCVAICICASEYANINFSERAPGYLIFGGSRNFSFRQPDDVKKTRSHLATSFNDTTTADFTFGPKSPIITLSIVGQPVFGSSMGFYSLGQLTAQGDLPKTKVPLGKPDDDHWRTAEVPYYQYIFIVYGRRDSSDLGRKAGDWYVTCGGPQKQAQKLRDVCADVRNTFSISSSGGTRDSRPAMEGWSGLFLAAAAGLHFWAQRRARQGASTAALDFASLAFLLTAMRWCTGYVFGGSDSPLDALNIAADLFAAMLGVLAIFAIGTMLGAGRKVQNAVSHALASTVVVTALFYLYVYAVRGSESQMIRAIIILIALSWELITSGSSLNPTGEHKHSSHSSRVLIFVGYLLLVAACVFVFSKQKLATGITVGSFDTEEIVANALATLGGALILYRLLTEISHLREPKESAQSS